MHYDTKEAEKDTKREGAGSGVQESIDDEDPEIQTEIQAGSD